MSAKLCVPAGASDQASAGETSAPSQVNFFGMLAPGSKAVLESFMATADPPFGWPAPEGAKTADRMSTASTVNSQNCFTGNISPVGHASPGACTGQGVKRPARIDQRRGPFNELLEFLAEEGGDFRMAVFFRERERRPSVVGARRRIGAGVEKHANDFETAVGGRLVQGSIARTVTMMDIGAMRKQPGDYVLMAEGNGAGERGVASGIARNAVDVGAAREQILGDSALVEHGGESEHRKAVGRKAVRRGRILFDKLFDADELACGSGVEEVKRNAAGQEEVADFVPAVVNGEKESGLSLLIKNLLQETRESESLTLVAAERGAAAARDNSAQSGLKFPLQKRISIPLALRESLEKQESGGNHAEIHARLAGRCDCGIGRRKLDRSTKRSASFGDRDSRGNSDRRQVRRAEKEPGHRDSGQPHRIGSGCRLRKDSLGGEDHRSFRGNGSAGAD